ncbi:methylated-DNA--[protein]-cysteine S-methyltransferase [Caenimonas sedimenti]|uniref:Methylated-DNA--protein-cysteine methyltransferase n=1 Tax=Caenimonas sedimenti TaxID=2596921 RepID=A0A562ZY04_9BURK|nr:methylated-DNA--[protein]-cysteine S-methyltransferase [Caenimonas sedimenti]TWO73034.1 methylated-DNA--[protein]-cysteine S-methyltransferase [Caenimonas sedimenti]
MKAPSDLVSCRYESPLGPMLLAATDTGVAGVWFVGQRHGPDSTGWPEQPDHPMLHQARQQLADYFAGKRAGFDLPLDLRLGTAFQQSVWQALLRIPRGETTSYGELSRRVGKPQAARAVGAAVGRNPVSIVVPCHRVVGTGGALTGYAGGLERKSALLKLEGALM